MSSNFKLLSDQFDDANGYIRMRVTPKGSYTFENVSSYTLEFFGTELVILNVVVQKDSKNETTRFIVLRSNLVEFEAKNSPPPE